MINKLRIKNKNGEYYLVYRKHKSFNFIDETIFRCKKNGFFIFPNELEGRRLRFKIEIIEDVPVDKNEINVLYENALKMFEQNNYKIIDDSDIKEEEILESEDIKKEDIKKEEGEPNVEPLP